MKIQNFFVHVIGCQQNDHDGIRIKFLLERLGFVLTDIGNADLIIFVACSVRQTAVDRIFGQVNNLLKNRPTTDDKRPTIIITGCVLDQDRKKFNEKNIWFWDLEKPEDLAKILNLKDGKKVAMFLAEGGKMSSAVPIMSGCNNFCSYCAVPYTRGREKSRPMEDIIKDVENLIARGQKEIILLGQNVNSYQTSQKLEIISNNCNSKVINHQSDFSFLLTKLNNLEGNFEISFMSNHPKDMSDDIIEAIATLPKVRKQIHLPLQSGSNKILKAMNRPYTIQQYLDIVDNLKFKIQNLKISTDVIVGFPGETEADFLKTVEIFKKASFDLAYINKYSPRSGTSAHKLGDPVPWQEKQRRFRILDKIANKKN